VAGVTVEGGGEVQILGARIHDNSGAGVLVRAAGVARIAGSRIVDNGGAPGRRGAGAGIELLPGARAVIERNVIAGNAAAGIRGLSAGDRDAALRSNTFRDGARRNRVDVAPASVRDAR
jgi:hypothetical protein